MSHPGDSTPTPATGTHDVAPSPVPPFAALLDGRAGTLAPAGPRAERRVSDLRGLFSDADAEARAARGENPVVYRTAMSRVPEVPHQVGFGFTTIAPGAVGGELHMTRGHVHVRPEAEIYLGTAGRGGLLLARGEDVCWLDIEPGTVGYIPPGWLHRSVNTGAEDYVFLAVYRAEAGQDYAPVAAHGIGARVLQDNEDPRGYRLQVASGRRLVHAVPGETK